MNFQSKQISKLRSCIFLSTTGLALMLDTAPACAQSAAATPASSDTLEEVIITAEKRSEDLQKTSISVAVLKGDDMQAQGRTDLNEALRTIPGVQIQGGANATQIYIRGVGPQTIGGGSTTTSQSVDDIFMTDQSSYVQFDLGQAEVLKGPQGTLQGSGSTGGSVLLRTADPTDKLGGQLLLQGGNFSAFRAEGAVNVPMTSSVQSRFSFVHSKRDGYYSNGGGDEDINAARAKFLFKPTDNLSAMVAAEYDHWGGKDNTTADAPIAAHASDPYKASNPAGGVDSSKTAVWGRLDWSLGWGVVTFEPSWYKYKAYTDTAFISLPSPIKAFGQQATQELRLASPDTSDIKWVVGVYHLHYATHSDPFVNFIVPDSSGLTNPRQTCTAGAPALVQHASVSCTGAAINEGSSQTQAAFGQLTYPLTDKLRALGGLRYTKNENAATSYIALTGAVSTANPPSTSSNNATTWKAGLEYDLAPQSMLYVTASTAARPGGLNASGGTVIPGVGTVPTVVQPEKTTAYELGSKNRFMDNRLEINGAAYYYAYKNMQATVVGPSTPATAPRPTLYSVNGDSTIYGAETQVQWLLTPADRVSVSAVYSHATWDSLKYPTAFYGSGVSTGGFPPGGCNVPGTPYGPGTNCFGPGLIDRSGVALTLAPEWTESLGYEHSFNFADGSSLAFNGTIRFVSEAQTTVEPIRTAGQIQPETTQESYHKSDARLTYTSTSGAWAVSAFVNNIEDVAVKQFLQGIPAGPPAAAPFNAPIFRTQLSPPRTFGINASLKF